MENLVLWVITILAYSFIWHLIQDPIKVRVYLQRAALLGILSLPLNINGNVFTVLGNAVSEKNVFSVASLYQKAGENAVTIFGVSGYQEAGGDTTIVIGVSGYQEAGGDAGIVMGVSGYQKAGGAAWIVIGVSGYQKAKERAETKLALSFHQEVGNQERTFGFWSTLSKTHQE